MPDLSQAACLTAVSETPHVITRLRAGADWWSGEPWDVDAPLGHRQLGDFGGGQPWPAPAHPPYSNLYLRATPTIEGILDGATLLLEIGLVQLTRRKGDPVRRSPVDVHPRRPEDHLLEALLDPVDHVAVVLHCLPSSG